jgi:ABC-type amino acid transport substrate-binding protein
MIAPPRKASRPWLAAAILFGSLASPAVLPAAPKTLDPGKLTVCLYPNFLPFTGQEGDGPWSGWDVTYLKQFAERHKLTFVVKKADKFEDIWLRPGRNECDIAGSGISKVQKRVDATGKLGSWSAEYYRVVRAYAVRKGTRLKSVADLGHQPGEAKKTVIVTDRSTADIDLTNQLACAKDKPDVTIERTNNESEGAQAVTAGNAFAYGGGLGSIEDLVKVKDSNLEVAWVHCILTEKCRNGSEPFSFVVRTESTGLAEELDEFIGDGKGYEGNQERSPLDIDCP